MTKREMASPAALRSGHLVVAVINLAILISGFRAFMAVRRGENVIGDALHDLLARRGFVSRILRSLFDVVTRSWHFYPLPAFATCPTPVQAK